MSRHDSSRVSLEQKIKLVEEYLNTNKSLKKVADSLNIYPKTLWRWVRLYRKEGKEALKKRKIYKRRLLGEVETKVMLLKEQNPFLVLNNARRIMNKEGVKISNKGIWRIWKRYGLSKRPTHDPLSPFVVATYETKDGIEKANSLIQEGNLKGAAEVLNSLPCLSENPILVQIPEKFLSPRRKLERLYLEFGKIPFTEYARRARHIGKHLEKNEYIYSSIIANFLELIALGWTRKPEAKLPILHALAAKMRGVKDTSLWFLYYFEQAYTYCGLSQIHRASELIKKCRRLVYLHPYPAYWEYMGAIMTMVGRYKDALLFYKKAFENERKPGTIEQFALRVAMFGYSMNGQYSKCRKILKKTEVLKNSPGFGATYSLAYANMSFGQGNLADANRFYLESLKKAAKGELHNRIYASSVGLAAVAMALNKRNQAKAFLRKYLPLMRKYKLEQDETILRCLLRSKVDIPSELILIPTIRILSFLMQSSETKKTGNYRRAFNYAQKQGLLGIFHRAIVFFPEIVLWILEKGKRTGLPKKILRYPVFNQKIPVYHVKFLGNFVVQKNQQYMKTRLTPKEKAFWIFLAMNASFPGRYILLNDLYKNFWPHSRNPSNLLRHLLVKLRKGLRLPTYLLSISSKSREPRLVNRGVYITTDYAEFETLLDQVRALERADEWNFAKREYLRVFKLFRGEPFKKMYDNWSENMRRVILNKLETEAIHFAKSCREHDNKRDAKRVLVKVSKIIPDSTELAEIIETCN